MSYTTAGCIADGLHSKDVAIILPLLWVQAMKNAFALRMSLGDPGPDPSNPYVNTTKQDALLHDTLSRKFADSLRYAK